MPRAALDSREVRDKVQRVYNKLTPGAENFHQTNLWIQSTSIILLNSHISNKNSYVVDMVDFCTF